MKSEGILQSYERIRQVLLASEQQTEKWADYHISLVRPDVPLIRAVRSLGTFEIPELNPGPTPRILDPKRIWLASIDGVFIEDAYVYLIR